jgi:hypothetical protein
LKNNIQPVAGGDAARWRSRRTTALTLEKEFMKILKGLIIVQPILLGSALQGNSVNQFIHIQVIDYVQQNVPAEISAGMNTELTLAFTETDFTYMAFSIPEANLTLIADQISWNFGTDGDGIATFEVAGTFLDDYFQGRKFLEASYKFYSIEGNSLSMPLESALLQPNADYTFSFEGQDSQGSRAEVLPDADPVTPPPPPESLHIEEVLAGWIYFSGKFFYSNEKAGWFYFYDQNNVHDFQQEVWFGK